MAWDSAGKSAELQGCWEGFAAAVQPGYNLLE